MPAEVVVTPGSFDVPEDSELAAEGSGIAKHGSWS
jgi:hypothetical protein